MTELTRKQDESDRDFEKRQILADPSRHGEFWGDQSEKARARWADPEYRARMTGRVVRAETRGRMSAAKKGGLNHQARSCWLDFRGAWKQFDTVTEAAGWLGVKQQVLDLWLRGISPWPGQGSRQPRAAYRHMVGLVGGFEV